MSNIPEGTKFLLNTTTGEPRLLQLGFVSSFAGPTHPNRPDGLQACQYCDNGGCQGQCQKCDSGGCQGPCQNSIFPGRLGNPQHPRFARAIAKYDGAN